MAGAPIDSGSAGECPDDGELRALIGGANAPVGLEDHLEVCENCRARLDGLAGGDFSNLDRPGAEEKSGALEQAILSLKTQPFADSPITDLGSWLEPADRPELLGMLQGYEVRRVIDEGGMGLVVEAWDPDLEREVAIKLRIPSL